MKFNQNHWLVIVVLTLLLSACSNTSETNEPVSTESAPVNKNQLIFTEAQYQLAEIGTGQLQLKSVSEVIRVNGTVEPEPTGTATLSAPLGGYLLTPALLPGQKVKKGEVLAELQNPEFIQIQRDYLESKARLTYLESEYKRQQALRSNEVNAVKTFEQVSADYQAKKAKVEGLRASLNLVGISVESVDKGDISSKAVLRSPINGHIKTSNFNLGNYVNPKDVVFEIVNREALHLVLDVYEKEIARVKEGQAIHFGANSELRLNRKASVFLVGTASEKDRVVPVHSHIAKNNAEGLLPGMYVKARIETDSTLALTAPEEAIVMYQGNPFLILQEISNNQYVFELVPVVLGSQHDGEVAVGFPGFSHPEEKKWVFKNAYAVLSAKINSEEN
ncbi:efflux RND transporter periplasmic adaptor subunit [Roseivirga spongicola]|uniref:CzcB-like barrel-sandwich hybrid domain-containing protein n=1 Tax=Roseivirga spongicola TaxID=333140 RepID=A0A150X5P7_9BACT|nr:efflux RND transporter periplasmic adaptor subunit [Roseivirga spongicola]KYG74065.1 hypothetical protein AWW68_15515 [Roseivirga spongicola]WPZ09285.1 efflux RND transporter periplasmic adaptor subunit [Roseivirga spongicola]